MWRKSSSPSAALVPVVEGVEIIHDPVLRKDGVIPSLKGTRNRSPPSARFSVMPELSLPSSALAPRPHPPRSARKPYVNPNKVYCSPLKQQVPSKPVKAEVESCPTNTEGTSGDEPSNPTLSVSDLFAVRMKSLAVSAPPPPRVISTGTVEYRVVESASSELERFSKMKKMGLPQGAIENAMMKDMIHPKSLFGADVINSDPKPPQIVISGERREVREITQDSKASLIEELARKQQEKCEQGTSGLSMEERIAQNKSRSGVGVTNGFELPQLRSASCSSIKARKSGTKAKRRPLENVSDLLKSINVGDACKLAAALIEQGFDLPEKFDTIGEEELVAAGAKPKDVQLVIAVIPKLCELVEVKEALECRDAEIVADALQAYALLEAYFVGKA